MATYFVKLSNGYKGQAADKCDYITRNGKYQSETLRQELVASESFNLPSWAPDGKTFFTAADKFERTNGTTFKQFIIMLPCELDNDENIKIAQDIKDKIIGDNKAGIWAIHSKQAVTANVQNIHLHLMNSERIQDAALKEKPPEQYFKRYNPSNPEQGGYKKDRKNLCRKRAKNPEIDKIRALIADAINAGYERNNLPIRVSGTTLEAQKEEAIAAGDNDRAEFFNRKPVKTISTKQWKKIQKIIEDDNIINRSQPVPIIPSENNWPTFEKLINSDLTAAEVLLERVSLQIKKLKYQFKLTQRATKAILKKSEEYITSKEFSTAVESIAIKVQNKLTSNSAYINLFNQIYANRQAQVNMINNFITRGRTKKYQKVKAKIKQAETQKSSLLNANSLDDKTKSRIELSIEAAQRQLLKLQSEIKKINKTPEAKKRYDYIINRLEKSANTSRINALSKNEENKILKEIHQEAEKLIRLSKLNSEQNLPKEIIKEIAESSSFNTTELRKKIKELSSKTDEFFPIKKEPEKIIQPKEKQAKPLTAGKDFQR